jgi:hypothetical protein
MLVTRRTLELTHAHKITNSIILKRRKLLLQVVVFVSRSDDTLLRADTRIPEHAKAQCHMRLC